MLSGFFKGNMLPENVKTLTDPRPAFAISIFFQSARLLTSKKNHTMLILNLFMLVFHCLLLILTRRFVSLTNYEMILKGEMDNLHSYYLTVA